ncbi:hypothetical protein KSP40_PGU008168 [Platanthera guangdongensis]|uniref:Uncharacterized protein n=1 Tax=Platanthera guangdongensis TaxID=2320717 RepID=A0ABR2MVI7_9ASPA
MDTVELECVKKRGMGFIVRKRKEIKGSKNARNIHLAEEHAQDGERADKDDENVGDEGEKARIPFDKTYWPTYKVFDVLQKVFCRSNSAREAFVEMCGDNYVQKMTFDSYLYKRVVPCNSLDNLKLAINIVGSLVRASAFKREMAKLAFGEVLGFLLISVAQELVM